MSKQSNQRFRKELEKCQDTYMQSMKDMKDMKENEKDSYNTSSNSSNSSKQNRSSNLVDDYNDQI